MWEQHPSWLTSNPLGGLRNLNVPCTLMSPFKDLIGFGVSNGKPQGGIAHCLGSCLPSDLDL